MDWRAGRNRLPSEEFTAQRKPFGRILDNIGRSGMIDRVGEGVLRMKRRLEMEMGTVVEKRRGERRGMASTFFRKWGMERFDWPGPRFTASSPIEERILFGTLY